jgi:serine/threonine-protein kinase
MELVDGESVARWARHEDPSWREVVETFILAARGLEACHSVGLLHNDLKPSNILVDNAGQPRLIDFGLAGPVGGMTLVDHVGESDVHTAGSSEILGTPAYMAPERLIGRPLDERSDLFSFCAAMWEVVFGECPFSGDTPSEVLACVLSGGRPRPTRDDVPQSLVHVLQAGLQADRHQRTQSVSLLIQALQRVLR